MSSGDDYIHGEEDVSEREDADQLSDSLGSSSDSYGHVVEPARESNVGQLLPDDSQPHADDQRPVKNRIRLQPGNAQEQNVPANGDNDDQEPVVQPTRGRGRG